MASAESRYGTQRGDRPEGLDLVHRSRAVGIPAAEKERGEECAAAAIATLHLEGLQRARHDVGLLRELGDPP